MRGSQYGITMFKKIKRWWNGGYSSRQDNNPSGLSFINIENKHWTSRLVHWLISLFVNPEKRAILLAVLGFITFIFMLLKYFSNTNA